jgi:hypothetical protein
METILELLALALVAAASCLAGFRLAGRNSAHARLALIAGFALVAWPIATLLWPDRLHFLYPGIAQGHIAFGSGFLLIGVLFRSYGDVSRRRILNGVLAAVLAYFVFAEPIHLAIASEEIRALDGGLREGVSIQAAHYSCVPASLATVLRHWGIDAKEGELAYALRTAFQGTHIARAPAVVAQVGASRGLHARVVSTSLAELKQTNRLPAVVLGYSGSIRHAVVLLAADERSVTVGDPLHGRQTIAAAQWDRSFRWTGLAIVVEGPPTTTGRSPGSPGSPARP